MMKYLDYMNQFTVSDETKETVFQNIKQRADQPLKSEGQAVAPLVTSEKKKNTFKLHPVRWVAIFVSIVLVLSVTPIAVFFGTQSKAISMKLEYMEDLMVETDGVTAYSIRKETEDGSVAPANWQGDKGNDAAISLLSASLVEDEADVRPLAAKKKEYNYLYSTTEEYSPGSLEYDETGIQRVTFKKNTQVTEDVYDNNGNLIDSERKITQEELDAQVNRIYTTKEFTFIQFVPKVEESGIYRYRTADGKTGKEYFYLRPDSLYYDENGVAEFDRERGYVGMPGGDVSGVFGAYYSSYLVASFVIDNRTGYIYKIENFVIDKFGNDGIVMGYPFNKENMLDPLGLLENERLYSISTDENDNLVITDVMPNEDIRVEGAVMDNDGWVFILNNALDTVDAEKKFMFYTDKYRYAYDSERNVYELSDDHTTISKKIVNGEAVPFENREFVRDLQIRRPFYNQNNPDYAFYLCGMYEDLSIYIGSEEQSDPDNGIWLARNPTTGNGLYVKFDSRLYNFNVRWMDSDYNTLIVLYEGYLYYKSVNLADYLEESVTLTEKDFTRLYDFPLTEIPYAQTVGDDKYMISDVYSYAAANGTTYYHIVKTTAGLELVELTSKSYTGNVFIFQPINK